MNIVLLAAPAAGKGTQSELIAKEFNLEHISTGNLLREKLKQDDELSFEIKNKMSNGELISDEIIFKLLKNKISNLKRGCILDGYPRTISQAQLLEKLFQDLNKKLNFILYIDIDKETAKKRITGRLTCSTCNRVYNENFEESRPIKDNVCDICKTELSHRSDDSEETFEKRYDVYLKETKPILDLYKNYDNFYIIDNQSDKYATFEQIKKVLSR